MRRFVDGAVVFITLLPSTYCDRGRREREGESDDSLALYLLPIDGKYVVVHQVTDVLRNKLSFPSKQSKIFSTPL